MSHLETSQVGSSDDNNERSMRKVAGTALAGTSIEWYDFFIYGTAAALVFPSAFFPAEMPATVALIASFSTFAVGFIARPLGGVVFGHYGDRVGRKKTLVVALLIMGAGTTMIGLLPTYESIGVFAPLLLVLLRFVQGLAIGGQWGGAMLLVTESAPSNKRGYYGAFAQAGAPIGVILANLAFLVIGASMSDESFMAWGWRVPFLASVVLVGISMYVQLNLEDTPAFKALEKDKLKKKAQGGNAEPKDTIGADLVNPNRSPVLEALRLYPNRIALAAGAFISIQVTFYILIAFVIAYGTAEEGLNLPRSTMLSAVLIACVVQLFVQFPSASYSDRHGRRGIYLTGAGLLGIWGFAIFPLIDTGNFLLIVLALSGGLAFLAMQYGPQAAFYTELFSTKVRYSAASLGYQIGAILGGAFAPTLAVLLWTELGIVYVSVYIGTAALITIASVWMLTETSGSNIHE